LLDQGLVARSEYDELLAQARRVQANAAAAREDLTAALVRGRGANRKLADLELRSSRARVQQLHNEESGGIIRAPASGVMVRPAPGPSGMSEIHAGQKVTRGQLIGSLARPEALVVELELDQADARRVQVGQPALVTVEGAGDRDLQGRVISVAGEATPPTNGASSSTVLARVQIDPQSQGLTGVRVGAIANVSIVVRNAPQAIVIPPEAVTGAPPNGKVLVHIAKSHRMEARAVILGQSGAQGVEVLSGLAPGDTVVWSSRSGS